MPKPKLIIISLLAISFASCALIKTLYNNAPEATHWWLDDYFDFTESQSVKLKPALRELHDWHRKTQLPIYINMLQKAKSEIGKENIEPSTVCSTMNTMQDSMKTMQLEASPIIMEIAPLLTEKQLTYFEKMLDKRATKWKSEWLPESRDEQIEARLEKNIDYAQKVYGDLNKSQKAMLKQKLLDSNYNPEINYTELLRRHEDLLQIVTALTQDSLDEGRKQKLIKQGFERFRNSPNSSYQSYADQLKLVNCEIIADLHATTDAKQKQHAKAWMENFITQFNSLILNKP